MRWNKKNIINLVSTNSTHLPAPITPPPPEIYRLPHPPPKPPNNNTPIPPTLTLSPSPHHSLFLTFLETNLPHHQTLTPKTLTNFLRSTLRHHPLFSHHDFSLFTWASTLDAFRHDHHSYLYMSTSLAATHRFSDLRRLLAFISSNPCPCSSGIFSCPKLETLFTSAIGAFCRAGKMDHALFGFDTMRRLIDGKPDVCVYNTLLNGFVKRREMEEALGFYKRMGKVDACTFNILMNGYCKIGEFERALGVFREMRERGCEPNVVSFNTLIRGFLGKGRIEEGVRMGYEMIELGCGVSEATCEILVDGLCRGGLVDDASRLVVDLAVKRVLPKGFDYGSLVERLCGEKKVDRAVEMMEEVWKNNNDDGGGAPPCLIACTTLVEGLRKSGRAEKASEFMEKMMNVGVVPDSVTFNLLLRDLCDSGRSMDANRLRVLATSKGFEADETTYHVLVSGLSKEGRRKEGEVLVNEMLDKDMLPDIFAYNRLMDGLSIAGKFSKKQVRLV